MSYLDCEQCKMKMHFEDARECNQCQQPELFNSTLDFSCCPICGGNHFYRKKDFNQAIGCIIILIGAILVPWTYGISLLILSIIDYLLYRRIKDSVECYKCKSEFKDLSIPIEIEPFNHHIAELYETQDYS